MSKSAWFGIVAVLALVLAATGCSKKPPAGEIIPPPGSGERETTSAPTSEREVTPSGEGEEQVVEILLADAFFEYDKYRLTPEARERLASNAETLIRNPQKRILIEGHCDERGTREYNLALGDRRAAAVRDFLVSYGVDANRIETISYGKERPFTTGSNEAAWAQNRRAHFVIR